MASARSKSKATKKVAKVTKKITKQKNQPKKAQKAKAVKQKPQKKAVKAQSKTRSDSTPVKAAQETKKPAKVTKKIQKTKAKAKKVVAPVKQVKVSPAPKPKPAAKKKVVKAPKSKPATKVNDSSSSDQADSKTKDKEPKALVSKPKGPYSADQWKKFQEYKKELANKSIAELKPMLKKNNQSMTGNKDELILKICDGKIHGQIPRCPSCFGGRPKMNINTGKYYCAGYRDDEDFVNCHKSYNFNELTRDAWVD